MKTETKVGTFSSARGQEFKPAVEFPYTVNLYETVDELVAAKDELSLKEQLKVRNADRVNKARQAEQNVVLDKMGIEKQDINNNDLLRLKKMYEVLMSAKGLYTEEQARALAATHLNLTWPDEDEG